MSRMRFGSLVVVTAFVIALATWLLLSDSGMAPVTDRPPRNAVPATEESADVGAIDPLVAPPHPGINLPATAGSPDYAAQYGSAGDLLSFLEALAPAAAEGDVDAMYYAAVASRRCTRQYAVLFGQQGKEMTLERALAKSHWTRYYEQLARKIHAQCQRFKTEAANPFTEWQNLLDAAVEGGSGPAKALFAYELQNGLIRVQDPATREQLTGEIRELAKDAIRSKEPEAIFQLAFVESITGRSGTPEDVAAAWMLAACQRGLECGRDSEPFQFFCRWDPSCHPSETLVDLFRRRPRFEEFQRLANELNARLDADSFDEIIP